MVEHTTICVIPHKHMHMKSRFHICNTNIEVADGRVVRKVVAVTLKCTVHDVEVMSSNPNRVELRVRSISIPSRT